MDVPEEVLAVGMTIEWHDRGAGPTTRPQRSEAELRCVMPPGARLTYAPPGYLLECPPRRPCRREPSEPMCAFGLRINDLIEATIRDVRGRLSRLAARGRAWDLATFDGSDEIDVYAQGRLANGAVVFLVQQGG